MKFLWNVFSLNAQCIQFRMIFMPRIAIHLSKASAHTVQYMRNAQRSSHRLWNFLYSSPGFLVIQNTVSTFYRFHRPSRISHAVSSHSAPNNVRLSLLHLLVVSSLHPNIFEFPSIQLKPQRDSFENLSTSNIQIDQERSNSLAKSVGGEYGEVKDRTRRVNNPSQLITLIIVILMTRDSSVSACFTFTRKFV